MFILSCLSAAFAKPVDLLDIPTSPDPAPALNQVPPGAVGSIGDIGNVGNVALVPTSPDPVPPLNQVFPGTVGIIGNVGNIALDNIEENKVQSPDFNLIPEAPWILGLNTIWPNPEHSTGVETTSSSDKSLDSYSLNIVAQQLSGLGIGRKPTLNWNDGPTFEVGAVLTNSRYHLVYPDYDGGTTSFICYEENLACCQSYESLEARFANNEGGPFSVRCQKCMIHTTRLF